jgi:hypothetical protein
MSWRQLPVVFKSVCQYGPEPVAILCGYQGVVRISKRFWIGDPEWYSMLDMELQRIMLERHASTTRSNPGFPAHRNRSVTYTSVNAAVDSPYHRGNAPYLRTTRT